ncbi:hypothetical protein MVEG_03022 [Podila verticillata NRRL 6337]|nr:hypothetical protein MVEG_03022 [Podila verticillata NRRL 6337]
MDDRVLSSRAGSTTPIAGLLDEAAQERQRHLRQNQEIIRLCSLKSIQARQLQDKMNQLERDNLDLRLALSRKDREAKISKDQSPSQNLYGRSRFREVRNEEFEYPGRSHQSPLSTEESHTSQGLLPQSFSVLNSSCQQSLQESGKDRSKSSRCLSASQESPANRTATLDRLLGAVETQQELIGMAIRGQNTMMQLYQNLFHSTNTPVHSHRRFRKTYRATNLFASPASVRSCSPVTLRPLIDRHHEKSSSSPYTPRKWSPRRKHSDKISPNRQSPGPPPNRPSPISTTSRLQTQRNFSPVLVFISPNRERAHAARPSSNVTSSIVVEEKLTKQSNLGTSTTGVQTGDSSVSKNTLKRPARQAPKSNFYIDQLPTIAENCSSQENTPRHSRLEVAKITAPSLSNLKLQDTSQPLTGTIDASKTHVALTDDDTMDLVFGSVKSRRTSTVKNKYAKVEGIASLAVARTSCYKVATKKGKHTARTMASSSESRTKHITSSPKQTSGHRRLLSRESLKQLSPGELLKKMNKKLLGRSQTPVLKSTQLSSTLAPTGSNSVWMSKSTRLGPSSNTSIALASQTKIAAALPADPRTSFLVDANASLEHLKPGPAHKKRRNPDTQQRQQSPLPSHSQESGTPEKVASEPRYELRKRKK